MKSRTSFALALAAIATLLSLSRSGSAGDGGIIQGDITIELEPVATGLVAPVGVTHANDGSGRLFIADQAGQIRVVQDGVLLPKPFLDISDLIVELHPGFDERGLLGVAFHPQYAENGRLFVRYSVPRAGDPGEPCVGTSRGCHSEVLAEFHVSAEDPNVADPKPIVLLEVEQPQFNHNAGDVAFGPDGLLYFTLGDGGGAHDGLADEPPSHGPTGHGQNIETLLGSMLRIDVDDGAAGSTAGLPYGIPSDNPFVGRSGRDEIFAYGFRNPYKFSFDDGPGGECAIYLGDVGQNLFEELDIVVAGGNYGWVIREGLHCFDPFNPKAPPADCAETGPLGEPLLDPILEYTQTDGGLSIIGGFVYRGSAHPELAGHYVFGDFSGMFGTPAGRLYYLDPPAAGPPIKEFIIGRENRPFGRFLKGFGEDGSGEVYACSSTTLAPNGATGIVERIVFLPPAFEFVATLGGDQENPPVKTAASGEASLELDESETTLAYTIELQGLDLDGMQTEDPADDVVGLHIHNAPAGVNGPVIFGIIGPNHDADDVVIDPVAGTVSGVWDGDDPANGTPSEFLGPLRAGLLYVNVHTPVHPSGEIRGQIGARPCLADIDGNEAVDVDDLVAVILAWGTADPAADVDGSGTVDVDDLVAVILAWGSCF